MTGDARGEAEQIVQVVRETSSLASCSDVVAALAAAIEVDEATEGGALVEPDFQPAFEYLRAALSALRARAGEET